MVGLGQSFLNQTVRPSLACCGQQCCHYSWFAAKSIRIFLLLAVKFSIQQLADI